MARLARVLDVDEYCSVAASRRHRSTPDSFESSRSSVATSAAVSGANSHSLGTVHECIEARRRALGWGADTRE